MELLKRLPKPHKCAFTYYLITVFLFSFLSINILVWVPFLFIGKYYAYIVSFLYIPFFYLLGDNLNPSNIFGPIEFMCMTYSILIAFPVALVLWWKNKMAR